MITAHDNAWLLRQNDDEQSNSIGRARTTNGKISTTSNANEIYLSAIANANSQHNITHLINSNIFRAFGMCTLIKHVMDMAHEYAVIQNTKCKWIRARTTSERELESQKPSTKRMDVYVSGAWLLTIPIITNNNRASAKLEEGAVAIL